MKVYVEVERSGYIKNGDLLIVDGGIKVQAIVRPVEVSGDVLRKEWFEEMTADELIELVFDILKPDE